MRHAAIVIALAGASLSGCFVSKGPLVDAAKAEFPYKKIVYSDGTSKDTMTLVHEGTSYLLRPKDTDSPGHVLLLKVADDLYVAQLDFVEDNEVQYLYSLLKVDLPKKTVASYKAVAGDADANPGPGLSHCNEKDAEQVCIDKLDAYVDYARKAIDAGAKPDIVYTIVSVE